VDTHRHYKKTAQKTSYKTSCNFPLRYILALYSETGNIVTLTLWRHKGVKVLFYPFLCDFLKNVAFWKVPSLRRCVCVCVCVCVCMCVCVCVYVYVYEHHAHENEDGRLLLLSDKHKCVVFIRHCCMFLLLTSAYNGKQPKLVVVSNKHEHTRTI